MEHRFELRHSDIEKEESFYRSCWIAQLPAMRAVCRDLTTPQEFDVVVPILIAQKYKCVELATISPHPSPPDQQKFRAPLKRRLQNGSKLQLLNPRAVFEAHTHTGTHRERNTHTDLISPPCIALQSLHCLCIDPSRSQNRSANGYIPVKAANFAMSKRERPQRGEI